MVDFQLATTDNDYAAAKLLFKEYADSIGINLDFQHFNEELDRIKTMYAPPYAGIVLAKEGALIIGCVGVRKITETIGELKRMYIKPGHRNKGIGKSLLEQALELARQCNYQMIKLDTLNHMLAAIRLYKQY